MRILFVNRMLSIERGGGETFDLEMARHLAELGCEVSVLSGVPVFGKRRLGPNDWWGDSLGATGLRISDHLIRTPYFGWIPWDKTPGAWRIRVADFNLFSRRAAHWAYRHRDQFDIIQVCELPFLVDRFKALESGEGQAAKRIPISMRLTAPDFYDPHGALQRADLVIASGTTMQKMREGARPDCENVTNGVDVSLFRPHETDFRERHGWGSGDRVVTFVARFQTVKNHAMLLDAFRQLLASAPNARLALAGSGPLEPAVRSQCASLGIAARVSFLGEMPFREVADLYAASDIAVIASDYESFSFVALEGMASGLPFVATATGWVPTLLGGMPHTAGDCPGGIVVPIGDAAAFASALKRIAGDRELRHSMGAWNRARVERDFGWAASAKKLRALYERIASQ